MSELKDGGPAFPLPDAEPGFQCSHPGMTLRDYFAAKAMHGEICGYNYWDGVSSVGVDMAAIATRAYQLADAMIAERSKTP